jgi:hypothetical protein
MASSNELATRARAIFKAADAAGREPTPDERAEVESLIDAAQSQKSIEDGIRQLDAGPIVSIASGGGPTFGTPGEKFVQSAGYKRISDIAYS